MKKYFEKGFTIIELLIVIAIIGVLAAVVLLAIDPLEQLDRGRDAGRKTSVAQLGHAVEAWATAQSSSGNYPGTTEFAGAGFQTFLSTAGEIKQIINNTGRKYAVCSGGTSAQGGFCYSVFGTTDFAVWAVLESKSEAAKGACVGVTPRAISVYFGSQGRAGVGCRASESSPPTVGMSLTF